MTPELKTACEVIFQEHKVSAQPIKWNHDPFRGRISLGLSDLAKDTLVKKNIIILPDKSKKIITQLNPAVATAASFEEAEDIIQNKKKILPTNGAAEFKPYKANPAPAIEIAKPGYSRPLLTAIDKNDSPAAEMKWYFKPLFYYVVWPLCAIAAGILICFLLDYAYTELFLTWK